MMLMRTEQQGKNYIVAQDPEGVSNTIMLPGDLEPILLMLDGKNSLRDIQVVLTRQSGGQIVPIDDVRKLMIELDTNLLLDTPRFRETREINEFVWNSFRLRKPFHAGQAYDKEPEKLKRMLDGFYTDDEGPGRPGENGKFVKGLLAPHIDLKSGGPVFAWAFAQIAASEPADLYVIFGTAHHHSPGPFSVTNKDYMSPIGILPTDDEMIGLIKKRFSPDWMMVDAVHQSEHSIEFQAIFLQHVLGAESKATVLPILAGFGHPVGETPPPWMDEDVTNFLDALNGAIEESGKKVTFIVGGDLAHIGPRYGNENPVLPSDLESCSEADHKMLQIAAKGDSKEFFKFILEEKDARSICGMPPLYAMLRLIEGSEGKLLSYNYWMDEQTRSAVTFASMVWHE